MDEELVICDGGRHVGREFGECPSVLTNVARLYIVRAIGSLVEGGDRVACRVMMKGRGSPEVGQILPRAKIAIHVLDLGNMGPGPAQHFALAGGR